VIYFPEHTTITQNAPGGMTYRSCQSYGGYHFEVHRNGLNFSYAAIPSCPGFAEWNLSTLEYEELATAHEVIEAATDALPDTNPAFSLTVDAFSPWILIGGEIGDLCSLSPSEYREGDFVAQRIWSNAAAMANDRDPCIPADPAVPYYAVAAAPDMIQMVAAGGAATFELTAWSTAAIPAWTVSNSTQGTFTPTVNLTATRMNNGDHATLTVHVPAGTASQSYAIVYVFAMRTRSDYHVTPVAVYVP
jgi:hypothetical protein